MKTLKSVLAVFLFVPGSSLLLYALWMWNPWALIGAFLVLCAWAGVELLK